MKIRMLLTALVAVLLALGSLALAQDRELADQDIADAIENEFLFDRAIDLNQIDVNVVEGVAELTGTVRHVLAKDRATEIAERVKGVRSVSNRLEVVPSPTRSDSEVRSDVVQALLRDPATDAYEIGVAVAGGIVTLTGNVESWSEKHLADTVAKGVKGVVDTRNEIDIEFAANRPDSEVKPEIENRLRWDVWVDDGLIDVAVHDGHVTLTGTVGSAAERRRAMSDAWVSGVRSVDVSGLEVEWWASDTELRRKKYAPRTDAEIERAVEDAALYDPRVASFNIEPDVQAGWITLRGTVDNLKAKRAAESVARNTVGVIGVTNRLKVRPVEQRSDVVVADEIEDALLANPTTDAYEILVSVNDGRATISGTVDSAYEKALAESVASGVKGVTEVRNLLVTPSDHTLERYPWSWTDSWVALPLTDERIRDQIENEFFWSPYIDSDDINIEVENSVATLTGNVESWRAYRAATENAIEGGAQTVVNHLSVNPPGETE